MSPDVPNPFIYGSPDGSRRRRGVAGAGASGARAPIELVAKAAFAPVKFALIDIAITAYFGLMAWAILSSSSEPDSTTPAEAWAIVGFTVLVLIGLLVGFGHFLLQYVGLLGVLYARRVESAWEFGPRWGFILRHYLRLEPGETLVVTADELPHRARGGRNYGKYLWSLNASAGRVWFRSPVGLSSTVHEQTTAWAEAHAVSITLGGVPQA